MVKLDKFLVCADEYKNVVQSQQNCARTYVCVTTTFISSGTFMYFMYEKGTVMYTVQ